MEADWLSEAVCRAREEKSTAIAVRDVAGTIARDNAMMPTSFYSTTAVLDFLVKRPRQLIWATFSNELNTLIKTIEDMILIQLALHEIEKQTLETVEHLMHRLGTEKLTPPVMCSDAGTAYDTTVASSVSTSQETIAVAISVRDRLMRGIIRALYSTDTCDTIDDCRTASGVDRSLIIARVARKVKGNHGFARRPGSKHNDDPRQNGQEVEQLLAKYSRQEHLLQALRQKDESGHNDHGSCWAREARQIEKEWNQIKREGDWTRVAKQPRLERCPWLESRKDGYRTKSDKVCVNSGHRHL